MTETQLRKPFVEALRKAGAIVVPYVGSTFGQQGTSDVFVAHKLWSGWIEFKGPKTKVEPIQVRFIKDMQIRRVNATIVRLLKHGQYQLEDWGLIGTDAYLVQTKGPYYWSADQMQATFFSRINK